MKTQSIMARLAALKTASTPDLRAMWKELFSGDAPSFNRQYLESRLAYRIQELAYGGLSRDTQKRLRALVESPNRNTARKSVSLSTGTMIKREWRGVVYSVTVLPDGFEYQGITGKSWVSRRGHMHKGKPIDRTNIYRILHNPLYVGRISHKDEVYPGEHPAIISQETWDAVCALFKNGSTKERRTRSRVPSSHLLRGILFDCEGNALTPHATKNRYGKTYRYYVSTKAIKTSYSNVKLPSVPAAQIEQMVIAQIRQMLTSPEMVFKTYQQARAQAIGIDIDDVRSSFADFNKLWSQLFPVEQNRIVRLLVERIEVSPEGIEITYLPNGLVQVCREMKLYKEAA